MDLSDVDRNLYQTLNFRAALHPSETISFFVTRVLAYCLNYRDGLEFSGGISTPDEPALKVTSLTGGIDLWIDIGNPTAKRIHKASKTAQQVLIYTYKDAKILIRDFQAEEVHKMESIGIYFLDQRFLTALGSSLNRDNHWEMTYNEGVLYVGVGKDTFEGQLVKFGI